MSDDLIRVHVKKKWRDDADMLVRIAKPQALGIELGKAIRSRVLGGDLAGQSVTAWKSGARNVPMQKAAAERDGLRIVHEIGPRDGEPWVIAALVESRGPSGWKSPRVWAGLTVAAQGKGAKIGFGGSSISSRNGITIRNAMKARWILEGGPPASSGRRGKPVNAINLLRVKQDEGTAIAAALTQVLGEAAAIVLGGTPPQLSLTGDMQLAERAAEALRRAAQVGAVTEKQA